MKGSLRAVVGLALSAGIGMAHALPVIPGASGYGIETPAGRGGKVYKVTNLNASGSGSLKACVDASGPRTCVFEVSGTIRLSDNLWIRNPYITIAGQTAPSPGVTIRGAGLAVATHDVLVQHLRVRVGDQASSVSNDNRDALYIDGYRGANEVYNVVIDHNSFTWASDEAVSVWNQTGAVTFRHNLIGESLHESVHPKGPHGYGPIAGQFSSSKVAFIGNVIAHTIERNPLSRAAELVFVNNVVYNWNHRATELQGGNGVVTRNTLIGNVYKRGRDYNGRLKPIWMRGDGTAAMVPGSKVYVEDNVAAEFNGSDPWSVVSNEAGSSYRASAPPAWVEGLKAMPTADGRAFDWALTNVGARPADRDSVDTRIVGDVRDGGGQIIDSQSDVGGWPSLAVVHRPLTLPSNPNGDNDGDGYTNLEEWLHGFSNEVEHGASQPTIPMPPENLRVSVAYP